MSWIKKSTAWKTRWPGGNDKNTSSETALPSKVMKVEPKNYTGIVKALKYISRNPTKMTLQHFWQLFLFAEYFLLVEWSTQYFRHSKSSKISQFFIIEEKEPGKC